MLSGKATICSLKPGKMLRFLSNEGYSNIYVDGGKIIQSFLQEDCIDTMIITRVPVLLGNGIPLFGFLEKDLTFKHIRTTIFSNGLVKSSYERSRS